ncbi:torsin-1A-interacting protein 2-like isoform X2 [Mastacembelus armatus]|uniref:Torsin-1A-interacting protein 2-like n=1 Tax=Mastacembelus armatus TaxID=205130 RepID=A0A3Q3RJ24_9TELE|nr:torsin-1A-interacting protein 2-like isoform X2 [Mastacembelus armatus]
MDSRASENKDSRPLRRSTRQSSVKDSPSKRRRKETGGSTGSSGDDNEMEVQESVEEMEKSQEKGKDIEPDPPQGTHRSKIYQGAIGDGVNLSPLVVLGERCSPGLAMCEDASRVKTTPVKPSTKGPATPIKSVQIRPPQDRNNVPDSKRTSMSGYKSTMEAKAKSTGKTGVNHLVATVHPVQENSYVMRQRLHIIPMQKDAVQLKKEGKKKTAVIKRSSGYSSRGFMWYLWCLVLVVLLSSAALLAYKKIPVLQRTGNHEGNLFRAAKPEVFADQLDSLQAQFPSQQPELWKRSKIHLRKHLQTVQPTEPVSLIFTAGRRAERTLHCLAQALASCYSSALNTAVLHIDGASKAGQDSDEVKLDIDRQLQAAFEGDKPVAIIHRFEELPPGSTLIFYRYCDHENAAYKQVFFLFTVLLPQDEVSSELSLKAVEEMVHDYVQERLVGSHNQTAFNKMDTDKYGGLWSRISHLILPVVSEKEIEQKGC